MRLRRDPESGLILPRERKIQAPESRLCSMLPVFQQGQFGRTAGSETNANANAYAIYTTLAQWLPHDQNNSDTFWDDAHTGNHDATLFASTTSNRTVLTGKISRAMLGQQLGTNTHGWYVPRSNTTFDFGDVDFTICLHWRRTGNAIGFTRDFHVIGRGGNYQLLYRSINTGARTMIWRVRNTGNTAWQELDLSINPTTNQWYLYTLVHDATSGELRAYYDTTKVSTSYSGGVYSGGTSNFCVETTVTADVTFGTYSDSVTAYYDESFVCANYAMTDADVSYVHNSGSGRSYDALKADAGF